MGGSYVRAAIYREQHFFLVVDCCRCEHLFAGKLPEIRPNRRPHVLQGRLREPLVVAVARHRRIPVHSYLLPELIRFENLFLPPKDGGYISRKSTSARKPCVSKASGQWNFYSHSTKTKQFRLCTFAFCLSHYFDFTIYLYYPVLKRPCYHFVIEVDNKNNFTVDNMEVVRWYYSIYLFLLQQWFLNSRTVFKILCVNFYCNNSFFVL